MQMVTSLGKWRAFLVTLLATVGLTFALSTDGTSVVSEPALAQPALRTATDDGAFDDNIIRISGLSGETFTFTESGNGHRAAGVFRQARHHYSKDQPWNADGSLFALHNYNTSGQDPKEIFLDGSTYIPKYDSCRDASVPYNASVDSRWNPNPTWNNIRVGVDSSSTGSLWWYNIVNCEVVNYWPFSTMPANPAGYGIGSTEGNISNSGCLVSLNNATHFFVVDMCNGAIGPAVALATGCSLADCTLDPSGGWTSVTPDGTKVVVAYDHADQIRVYDLDPFTLTPTAHNYGTGTVCGGLSLAAGFVGAVAHADLAQDPNNVQYIVGQGRSLCGSSGSKIPRIRLSDGNTLANLIPTGGGLPDNAYVHHVSARNINRKDVIFATFTSEVGHEDERFWNEVVAFAIDGSGYLERYAHTHTLHDGCYRCEAHGVPDQSGLRVVFASNWQQDCGGVCGAAGYGLDYVVEVP